MRLANVITLPEYRGHGHGTTLVVDVINWARIIDADRVDLGATPAGQRLYEKVGFTMTSAPRISSFFDAPHATESAERRLVSRTATAALRTVRCGGSPEGYDRPVGRT